MQDQQPLLGDTPPEVFRKQLHQLADWIADFREGLGNLRVAPNAKPGAIRGSLPSNPPENPETFDEIIADIDRLIVPGMVHWSHPRFLGYFGWPQTGPGILGEIATVPLNVNAMTWRTSPAATELETLVVDWARQMVRLPEKFGGVVYDTASVGIMHALAVAREEAAPSTRKLGLTARNLPRFRIYTSDQAHSSVEKAAIALGLGEENVQRVATDAQFRMDVAALRAMIERDLASRQGAIKPLAAVATVGTTSTASVDPVADIAKICREHKMWLHVDAAYGGGFAILPEYEWITKGWSDADSVVINPHKTLFVPLDFSILYVRDLERLRRVFTLVPEYLRGDTIEAEKNYMDYGIQLGRRFRALKAWVIWRSLGRAGMAARLQDQMRLTNLLADWIKADDRFELGAPVVMPVVCFRLVVGDESSQRSEAKPDLTKTGVDDLNSQIVERINASGRAYLTQTKLHGRTVMRIGLGNVLTTEEHLRLAWELIQETADESLERASSHS
ncbi:MAG TPA: pyridoxal-dependent decarboxylase [Chthoniobacterales bacterium]|nr:pyridoxal-dependent decarboxylase [Chthoniobacterales bacterium]